MITEDLAYEGFASPKTGVDNMPLLEMLIIDHGKQIVDTFLERHATRLERSGSGLVPALKTWLQADTPYDAVCNFTLGDMYSALLSEQPDELDRCAAALAIRMHAFGLEGEWQFQLDNPVSFLFDRWMLPLGDAVRVSATSQTVLIDTHTEDGWRQTAFRRRGENGWESNDAKPLPLTLHPELRCTVVPVEYLPAASPAQLLAKGLYDGDSRNADTNLFLKTCSGATELISEYAGMYLPWVRHVVKDLIPLPPRPGVLHSASGNLAPGVISVTNQDLRCALAEQLVHEATHQYLYILKRLGPMDDGTDETLYFSPFRNMGRPILYILFAYHAFANVLLFYRMARANGLSDDEPGMSDQQKLEENLQTVDKALQTTRALTPLGRALWEPLRDFLRQ